MLFPWVLCGALLAVLLILSVKLWLLRKAFDEIRIGLGECLEQETNILVSISTRDRRARRAAAALNGQLRLLRKQRLQYQTGDRELKEAVANISHDLRTPVTAIRGYLDLLDQEEMPEDVRRYLLIIENRIEALSDLLDELFIYSVYASSMEDEETSDVCLNRALEESIAEHYAVLKEQGITPIICLSDSEVIRQLDKSALSRVFGNILDNAAKYSGGDLEISLYESGEMRFTNTAPELTEVQVGKLFNRFYTVNAARNSTGLGLAISRMLVERMGGRMSAEYADGKLSIYVSFDDSV